MFKLSALATALLLLSACAVITVPVKVATTAAKTAVKTVGTVVDVAT